jgi:hypothetical protein
LYQPVLMMWRREWDSNPREVSLKLISSQPRYDRFDTPPQRMNRKRYGILCGKICQALREAHVVARSAAQ